jgi:hypothetical protein
MIEAGERRLRLDVDDAVRRCSAFHGIDDLLESINKRKYVPTLRDIETAEPEFNNAVRLVRTWLQNRGYAVYPADQEKRA